MPHNICSIYAVQYITLFILQITLRIPYDVTSASLASRGLGFVASIPSPNSSVSIYTLRHFIMSIEWTKRRPNIHTSRRAWEKSWEADLNRNWEHFRLHHGNLASYFTWKTVYQPCAHVLYCTHVRSISSDPRKGSLKA